MSSCAAVRGVVGIATPGARLTSRSIGLKIQVCLSTRSLPMSKAVTCQFFTGGHGSLGRSPLAASCRGEAALSAPGPRGGDVCPHNLCPTL